MGGLEPPLREELDPKSSAATNYATSAKKSGAKVHYFFRINATKVFAQTQATDIRNLAQSKKNEIGHAESMGGTAERAL